MLTIGNGELEGNPRIGKEVECPHCGGVHPVQYGEKVLDDGTTVPSNLLAFYKCGGKAYLVGVDGVDIRNSVKTSKPDDPFLLKEDATESAATTFYFFMRGVYNTIQGDNEYKDFTKRVPWASPHERGLVASLYFYASKIELAWLARNEGFETPAGFDYELIENLAVQLFITLEADRALEQWAYAVQQLVDIWCETRTTNFAECLAQIKFK